MCRSCYTKFEQTYRKCQILQSLSNLSIGRGIFPGIIVNSTVSATVCTFMVISYHDTLDFFAFTILLGFIGIGIFFPTLSFEFLSRVSIYSSRTLDQFKYSRDREKQKTIQSCPGFHYTVGELFAVQRTSVMLYFSILLDHVVTLILWFGKKKVVY